MTYRAMGHEPSGAGSLSQVVNRMLALYKAVPRVYRSLGHISESRGCIE